MPKKILERKSCNQSNISQDCEKQELLKISKNGESEKTSCLPVVLKEKTARRQRKTEEERRKKVCKKRCCQEGRGQTETATSTKSNGIRGRYSAFAKTARKGASIWITAWKPDVQIFTRIASSFRQNARINVAEAIDNFIYVKDLYDAKTGKHEG